MIMRLIAILLICAPLMAVSQDNEIDWISLNEAEKRMKDEPRKVIIDVYTKWCGPCKMMNRTTFQDPDIVEFINDNYYAIKFNAESPDPVEFKGNTYKNENYDPSRKLRNSTHDLTKAIAPVNGRIAYPTVVFLDQSFKLIAPVQGYRSPKDMKPLLEYIQEEVYAQDVGYQEYLKSRK